MTAPTPYAMATHIMHEGTAYVITDRVPHGESWRYTANRPDLSGPAIHLSHGEVGPALSAVYLPDTARNVIANAGLDVEVFDEAQAAIEADEEIARAASSKAVELIRAEEAMHEALGLWHHGYLSDAELHETYKVYAEAK